MEDIYLSLLNLLRPFFFVFLSYFFFLFFSQDFETADYKGPRLGAEKLAEFVKDKRAKILDAGCGVGTVGLQVRKATGFRLTFTCVIQAFLCYVCLIPLVC